MHTAASLQTLTVKDLGKLAASLGVTQWRTMLKDDLVREVLKAEKRVGARPSAVSPAATRTKSAEKQIPEEAGAEVAKSKAKPQPASVANSGAAVGKPKKEPRTKAAVVEEVAAETQARTKAAVVEEVPAETQARQLKPKPPVTKDQAAKVSRESQSVEERPSAGLASRTEAVAAAPAEAVVNTPSASSAARKTLAKTVEASAAAGAERPANSAVSRRIQKVHEERARTKNLATVPDPNSQPAGGSATASNQVRDRIVLLVRDAYWIQAWWELTRPCIERAKAAMAEHWHTAQPMLRLVQVETGGATNSSERILRDIAIHGGVKTWYIDVKDSPKSYRVDIGYLGSNDRFFCLARSNSVTTPRPSAGDLIEDDWSDIADNCEKIYALSGGYTDEGRPIEIQELFEERLGRPMGSPIGSRFGVGADRALSRRNDFEFDVDAEMIIYGTTRPNAHVTLAGTPIKLRSDGSFSARLSMPDRRQVLPIVAASPDGIERRTVVLAVERNTKVMEPQFREIND